MTAAFAQGSGTQPSRRLPTDGSLDPILGILPGNAGPSEEEETPSKVSKRNRYSAFGPDGVVVVLNV